jgi:FtsX-like permease family
VRAAGPAVELRYVLTRQRTSRVRAAQATDRNPPSVLVTPVLAELAGGIGELLPMQLTADEPVTARVAGVIERFPGTSGEVIVGDRKTLRTALNAAAPGTARENEVWVDVPDEHVAAVRAALSRPPFRVLASTLRADVEAQARRDPLAHGTLVALGAAALLALALAAVGLTLAVRSDLRDDRGELYELEAQGASPIFLCRVVRARAVALSLAGIVAGAVTGALLLTLVTRVVSVTARGGFAEPPLAITVDSAVVVAGVLAYVLLAAVLVGAATRRAFSESRGPMRRSP